MAVNSGLTKLVKIDKLLDKHYRSYTLNPIQESYLNFLVFITFPPPLISIKHLNLSKKSFRSMPKLNTVIDTTLNHTHTELLRLLLGKELNYIWYRSNYKISKLNLTEDLIKEHDCCSLGIEQAVLTFK